MFNFKKNNQRKSRLNRKGFSLVEVLIAIGILVLVTVPLAMNLISSSQINSKAKQTASSSNLTTSIMEIMQTVDLSDILTDVNGYSSDEYGTVLPYTLSSSVLKDYELKNMTEVIMSEDGKYFTPVSGTESSIDAKNTGDAIRAYFTGQKDDNYAFIITDLEDDESRVDIVAIIKPEQSFNIVNITSMQQTEVVYARQSNGMDREVATEFAQANLSYVATHPNVAGVTKVSVDTFLTTMKRTIVVEMTRDNYTDAVDVEIYALYETTNKNLNDADKQIKKRLGSFSTNSTSEMAHGVYVYYYPLMDNNNKSRDYFQVKNKNELSAPVYFIAMSNDTPLNFDEITNYHPNLHVVENEGAKTKARTTVCSNVPNSLWSKTLFPSGVNINVKTLGNASMQQTLYSLTLQVYRHRDDSYDNNGVFTPRSKDLLVETKGSFIDTSEKLDIETDKDNGTTPTLSVLSAAANDIFYTGNAQRGVYCNNENAVEWSGTTEATDVGTYIAYATPKNGYVWSDGTNNTKTITWSIYRAKTATVNLAEDLVYNGSSQTGVSGQYIDCVGITVAKDQGSYKVTVTPDKNHAWQDGTYNSRDLEWTISPKTLGVSWATGLNKDYWIYDGQNHSATYQLNGIETADKDKVFAVETNNSIRLVGKVTVKLTGLYGDRAKNYTLPITNVTHDIEVKPQSNASITLKSDGNLTYNGAVQEVIASNVGVIITGPHQAKNAGTYQFSAKPIEGYEWDGGGTSAKTYSWKINKKVVTVQWGTITWTYDGTEKKTTCVVTNPAGSDNVQVYLTGNSIRDAGTTTVKIASLSDSVNYELPASNMRTRTLTVNKAKTASYEKYDFLYNGQQKVGVVAYCCEPFDANDEWRATDVKIDSNYMTISYVVTLKPSSNYEWADGSGSGEKTVEWKINPIEDASFESSMMLYTGGRITGVFHNNTEIVTGTEYAKDIGGYPFTIRPIKNHAWKRTSNQYCVNSTKTLQGHRNIVAGKWAIEIDEYTIPAIDKDYMSFVYDGQPHKPELELIGLTDGYILTCPEYTEVGTYEVKASLVDPTSSRWNDGTTTDKILTWKITPKPIHYTVNSNTWTYDSTEHTGGVTLNASEIVAGDTVNPTYSGTRTAEDAGTYNFTVTGVDNKNYYLADSSDNKTTEALTLTINKRDTSATIGTKTWTYDGNSHQIGISLSNIVSGDDVYGYAGYDANYADTYVKKAQTNTQAKVLGLKGSDASNYNLTNNPTCYITIYQKEAKLSWGSLTKTYDGTKLTSTCTVSNLCSGDTCTVTIQGNGNIDAGDYTLTAKALSNSNYKLPSSTTKTQTISKANSIYTKRPTAANKTYNGSAQEIVNMGTADGGTIYYSIDDSAYYTRTKIEKTNADSYTIGIYIKGDKNHEDSAKSSFTASIYRANGCRVAYYARVWGTVDAESDVIKVKEHVTVSGTFNSPWTVASGTYYEFTVTAHSNYQFSDGGIKKSLSWVKEFASESWDGSDYRDVT